MNHHMQPPLTTELLQVINRQPNYQAPNLYTHALPPKWLLSLEQSTFTVIAETAERITKYLKRRNPYVVADENILHITRHPRNLIPVGTITEAAIQAASPSADTQPTCRGASLFYITNRVPAGESHQQQQTCNICRHHAPYPTTNRLAGECHLPQGPQDWRHAYQVSA